MDTLTIRNWDKWQSYRSDRGQPPWIKVHRALLRDPNWVELTDAQRGQLVAIWMLAADRDGVIPASAQTIRKLCFMDSEPDLQVFVDKGFIEPDANMTPVRRQHDVPEKSRGEERREEERRTMVDAVASTEVFANEFHSQFWSEYPHKIAKATALKAFIAARKRTSLGNLLSGLRRYIDSKPPDRQWRNPATWLNGDGWLDEPAEVAAAPPQMSRLQRATLANIQEIANGKVKDSNRNGSGNIRSQAPRLVYAATPRSEDDAQNNYPEADRPADVATREID